MRTEVKKWAGCVGLMGAIALGGPAYADFPIGSRWVEYLGSNEGGADWGKTARFDSSAANRIDTYMPEGKDVVVDFLWPTAGDAEGIEEFMNQVLVDGGAAWYQDMFDSTVNMVAKQESYGKQIYFQFDNEINSSARSEKVRNWLGQFSDTYYSNDNLIIPLYAEAYLALGLKALHDAEASLGIELNAMLGSIANASNEDSRAWMEQLLSYEFVGWFVPEYTGLRVADLVDYISIHYHMTQNGHFSGPPDETASEDSWWDSMEKMRVSWMDSGLIKGIWSTEEVGRQASEGGLGAAGSLKVAARYLHWANENSFTPEQTRGLFWGSNLTNGIESTSASYAMNVLFNFLGDTELRGMSGFTAQGSVSFETIMFSPRRSWSKFLGFIIPRDSDTDGELDILSYRPQRGKSNAMSGELHIFGDSGHTVTPVNVELIDGSYEINLTGVANIGSKEIGLLLLQDM